jgi:hypothetical protein
MSNPDVAANSSVPVLATSTVTLLPFQFLQEGDQCYIECPDPDDVLILPAVGLNIMQMLQQGLTIDEVAQRLPADDPDGYDIIDFVQTLMSYGLVQAVDGARVAP